MLFFERGEVDAVFIDVAGPDIVDVRVLFIGGFLVLRKAGLETDKTCQRQHEEKPGNLFGHREIRLTINYSDLRIVAGPGNPIDLQPVAGNGVQIVLLSPSPE